MDKIAAFRELIRFLEEKEIRYAVVGDTDGYPESIESDIDLVVWPRDFPRFFATLPELENSGMRLIQRFRHEVSAFYYIFAFRKDDGGFGYMMPDVCTHYYRFAHKLIDADTLLDGALTAKSASGENLGFKVPAPAAEFLYYLVKKAGKGKLDEEQFRHLSACHLADPSGCMKLCRGMWSERTADEIDRIFRDGDLAGLREHLGKMNREMLAAHPVRLLDRACDIVRRVRRFTSPTGFLAALPDAPEYDAAFRSGVIGALNHAFRRHRDVFDSPCGSLGLVKARAQSTLLLCPEGSVRNPIVRAAVDWRVPRGLDSAAVVEGVVSRLHDRMKARL